MLKILTWKEINLYKQNLLAETQRKLNVLTNDTNGYKKLLEGLIAQVRILKFL